MVLVFVACAVAPEGENPLDLTGKDRTDSERADAKVGHSDAGSSDDDSDDDDPSEDVDERRTLDAGRTARGNDGGPDGVSSARDGGSANRAPGDIASADGGALRGLDAGGGAGASDAGSQGVGPARDAAPASACNPLTCTNNCALFSRCCNADGECACQDPVIRMCTLPSLSSVPGF